nr:dihydrofolate reductase family protein [Frankia sp. Cr1]
MTSTATSPRPAAAGDTYVNVLGASTARQCLDAGLLDEILVLIVPVLLGDGVRLSQRAAAVPA